MAAKKKPAPKAKAAKTAAPAKQGGGKKAFLVIGAVILLIGGLSAQVFFKQRQMAKLKFDMVRMGRNIPQGNDKGQGSGVVAISGDKADNLYFLTGEGNSKPNLQKFDPQGNFQLIYEAKRADEALQDPQDLAVEAGGGSYVLAKDGRIFSFDTNLKLLKILKTGVQSPTAIGVDSQGRILVCSQGGNKVAVLAKDGSPVSEFGAPGTNSGDLTTPSRMRVTADDQVVVLEQLPTGLRCKVFSADHKMTKVFDIKNLQNCPPLRMGVNSENLIYFNDHIGARGVVVYGLDGKLVGDSQATRDGEKFVSPGAVGANPYTPSVYVHTVPGLIKCVKPAAEEAQ